MKKLRLAAAVSACALACSWVTTSPISFAVSADENTSQQITTAFDISDTVKAGITGKTSLVGEGAVFDYTLGVTEHTVTNNTVSTLFTGWKDFDTVSASAMKFGTWDKADYNLAGNAYGTYFNANTADSNCQVRVNWMQNITYKLTFNQAAVLTVTNEAISGILTSDNVIYVRIYKETDGEVSRLSEKALYDGTNTSQAENYFGGEYTMAEGESFYFEYGCRGAYEKSLKKSALGTGIFPTFTADASKIEKNVNTDLLSVISASYGSNGGAVKINNATFTPAWGTLTDNQAFDLLANNALQTNEKRDDGLYAAVYAGGSSKIVRTNGAKQKFFLKVTATEGAKISFDSEAITQATNGTAYYTVYEGITHEGQTHYAKRFEKSVGNEALESGVLAYDMHVPAGNEVVLEIYGASYGTNIYLLPTLKVNFDAYDETENYDFTEIIALASYKTEKQSALQTAYTALDRTDYLADDLADIDAAYASAMQDIKAATDKAKVDLAIAGYEGYISEIVTISTLAQLKTQYKSQLDDYMATLNTAKYSSEDLAKIQAFISEGKTKIDNAITENAMDIAVKHAKAEIELIPVIENEKDNGSNGNNGDNANNGGTTSTEKEEESSCSSSLSLCATTALCAVAMVTLRKKKEGLRNED